MSADSQNLPPEGPPRTIISLPVDADTHLFLEQTAEALCNTKVGIIRLAIKVLREKGVPPPPCAVRPAPGAEPSEDGKGLAA